MPAPRAHAVTRTPRHPSIGIHLLRRRSPRRRTPSYSPSRPRIGAGTKPPSEQAQPTPSLEEGKDGGERPPERPQPTVEWVHPGQAGNRWPRRWVLTTFGAGIVAGGGLGALVSERVGSPSGRVDTVRLLTVGAAGRAALVACSTFTSFVSADVATAGAGGDIYLWDLRSAMHVRTIDTRESQLNSVAFDPLNRNVVAASGKSGLVHLWDTESGLPIITSDVLTQQPRRCLPSTLSSAARSPSPQTNSASCSGTTSRTCRLGRCRATSGKVLYLPSTLGATTFWPPAAPTRSRSGMSRNAEP